MSAHVRANLWLLGLTLLLCSVVYPLLLWVIGLLAFPNQAEGSLIRDKDGKPVASRLIAHEVKGDEYFQPRPSAAGWNGAASGASNWGANNPLLRDRVAKALGPIVKYKSGQAVGPDVAKWARATHPDKVEAKKTDDEIAGEFFDRWRQAHPDVELEEVPADLVTASASGLDPHITLKNARYQLDRVAGKWAELTGQDATKLRGEIDTLLTTHASAPMFGLAGVEMVNVVEINLALKDEYGPRIVTPR